MIDAEYTLTEDDFLTFHRYTVVSVPGIKLRYWLFRWGVPLSLMLNGIGLTVRMPHDAADKVYGIGFIGVAILLLIGMPFLYDAMIRMRFRTMMRAPENRLLSEPVRVTLLPDKMQVTTSATHEENEWKALLKITDLPTLYLFWFSLHDAIIVPKRAFQTPARQSEFEQTFQRYRSLS